MVPFEQMTLLHKISYKLLSKNHDIIGLDLKGHPTLAELSIDQKLAPLILESIFLFQKVLCCGLNLLLKKPSKLIKMRVHNHFDNLILIQLIVLLEDMGFLFLFLVQDLKVFLKVLDIEHNSLIYVFHIELLLLKLINACLEKNLLFLVKVFENLLNFV